MFSKSLARAANRSCASAAAGTSSSTTSAVCFTARRQHHQRRHSSSKTSSCPTGRKAAAEEKAGIAEATTTTQSQQQRGAKRVTRPKRSRSTAVPDKQEDQFAGLPAVPGMHMSNSDFGMSSFFSLHRPLSLATTIPPPSTPRTFDSIFVSQKQRDPWENGNSGERRPEDVVYTLNNLFEGISSGQPTEEDGVRWEVVQEQQEGRVKHLDGAPRTRTLDEMVAQLKPFEAPPPPQPFPELQPTKSASATEKKQRASSAKPKQTRYATTMLITESTSETGQTTYTASTSPFVRITEGETAIQEPSQQHSSLRERRDYNERAFFLRQQEKRAASQTRKPFIRNAPSAARFNRMLLISVKRQRKLKMKKHKYKKLMKRTRNLRRRQDRA